MHLLLRHRNESNIQNHSHFNILYMHFTFKTFIHSSVSEIDPVSFYFVLCVKKQQQQKRLKKKEREALLLFFNAALTYSESANKHLFKISETGLKVIIYLHSQNKEMHFYYYHLFSKLTYFITKLKLTHCMPMKSLHPGVSSVVMVKW